LPRLADSTGNQDQDVDKPGTQDEAIQLMREIALGRDAALTRLIAIYGRGLALYASRFLGSPSEGDDVVQDTFLRVWQTAGRYDPARAAVSTWIYRIAANLCIDRQRRGRFWRLFGQTDVQEMAEVLPHDSPDATSTVGARQELAAVRQAIAGLPDRQRTAILLAAVAGMDRNEIAAIMDTNAGAVEQLLVRARRTLRERTGYEDARSDRR
jgi:RNA polymerase sigma-70 factor, ECF subfamily